MYIISIDILSIDSYAIDISLIKGVVLCQVVVLEDAGGVGVVGKE